MSKKYRFGQFVGIVIGVIAGHTLINALLRPRQQVPPPQPYPQQQQYPVQNQIAQTNNQGVFEQALSK